MGSFVWNSMHRNKGLRLVSLGGGGRVGFALRRFWLRGQLSEQRVRIPINDGRIGRAALHQSAQLLEHLSARRFAACNGAHFFSFGECCNFSHCAEHFGRCRDLAGLGIRVSNDTNQTLYY